MGEGRRLPESELEIMLSVWGLESGATASAILERTGRELTASALHSYLKRLEEKGFLRCEKDGKVNHYTPLITKAEYQKREGKTILEKLYGGSLRHFTAALYDGGGLAKKDVAELRAYLDELERGDG